MIGSRIGAINKTASSANDARKGTMITMALIMTIPTCNVPQLEDAMKGGRVRAFSHDLQRVRWPLNFKP
jgi:hypothetical protein